MSNQANRYVLSKYNNNSQPREAVKNALVSKLFMDPNNLSKLYAQINNMNMEDLHQNLSELHLHTGGSRTRRTKRLKLHLKRTKNNILTKRNSVNQNKFPRDRWYDYLIVIDFECTCEEEVFDYYHEIVEFPAILLRTKDMKIVDEFHAYIRPRLHPVLDPFCTKLTGVTQAMVDESQPFLETLANFEGWMDSHGLGTSKSYALVTDGPWDFAKFFQMTCIANGLDCSPHQYRQWVNIRRVFANLYLPSSNSNGRTGTGEWKNLEGMLEHFGMTFEGRPHCGLDDSRNLARIVAKILEDGHEIRVNERLLRRDKCIEKLQKRTVREEKKRLDMTTRNGGTKLDHDKREAAFNEGREKRRAGMTDLDKDRQVWRDTLPYKNIAVSRQEFLLDLNNECETCSSSPESDSDAEK